MAKDEFDESEFDKATLEEAEEEIKYQQEVSDGLIDGLTEKCRRMGLPVRNPSEALAAIKKAMPKLHKKELSFIAKEIKKRYKHRH
jgi:hypothetical protein